MSNEDEKYIIGLKAALSLVRGQNENARFYHKENCGI